MVAQTALASTERQWGRVIARAWSDEDFKQRLMDDPRGALAECGIDVPDDVDLFVMEDTDKVRHFVLPPPPTDELTDEQLGGSGVAWCYSGHCGRCGCGCGRCGCHCD